jgi:hypothetical protein
MSDVSGDAVEQMCHKMEEHQTSRGDEFRTIGYRDRRGMARNLVIARSQVEADNGDWESNSFRRAIRRCKEAYCYEAGSLGIDRKEAEAIWKNVVYENVPNDPHTRNKKGYI